LLLATALFSTACAAETPMPATHAAIVFITFTPSPVVAITPTEEVLPFRDLAALTATDTPLPPSDTPEPATATPVSVVVATQSPKPTTKPATILIQPTAIPQVAVVQPTAPLVGAPTDVPVPAPTAIPVQPVSGDVASVEQAIIDLTNTYRAQSGLAPLARDEGIMAVARSRSNDMVARDYFGHYDPVTGQSLARPLIQALGYSRAGENIYWSGKALGDLPSIAVGWFMGDAPHRDNILNSAYRVVGVGVVWNGVGWTLTQDFGG
jgi:uncharacterized protein YkwD